MDKSKFYTELRKKSSGVFGTSLSVKQVAGMEGLLEAAMQQDVVDIRHVAYGLATAYHETGARMVPVREGFAKTDAGARRAVQRLAKKRGPKSAVAKYVRPIPPYGHVYYGRGHVQLTWAANYKAMSEVAGVDLFKNPDLMLDPIISAKVLISGLMAGTWNGSGNGLAFYINDDKLDLRNARRTVNITDKWQLIGQYYNSFHKALQVATVNGKLKRKMPAPVPAPTPPIDHVPVVPEKKKGLAELFVDFIAALFGKGK